jgi:DNA-binding LacI/PurR family transcriptional regulator
LTTVHVPREDLGRLGFEILEKMRRSSKGPFTKQKVETHLVIRKSTAAPRPQSQRA